MVAVVSETNDGRYQERRGIGFDTSKAACKNIDPNVFYPTSENDADEAKAICAPCPIKADCLDYALRTRERDGVWGGATEKERRRIIRRRRVYGA